MAYPKFGFCISLSEVHLAIESGEIVRSFSALDNYENRDPLDVPKSRQLGRNIRVPSKLEEQRENLRLAGGGTVIRTLGSFSRICLQDWGHNSNSQDPSEGTWPLVVGECRSLSPASFT